VHDVESSPDINTATTSISTEHSTSRVPTTVTDSMTEMVSDVTTRPPGNNNMQWIIIGSIVAGVVAFVIFGFAVVRFRQPAKSVLPFDLHYLDNKNREIINK